MNKFKFALLAIAVSFASTAAASDIEFHGYTRAGVGLNTKGGGGTCFHLNNADTDYRLGNECDYVIEPNFEITMAKLDDKSAWGFHFMPKAYKRWQTSAATLSDPLDLSAGQVYFFGNNIPWLANGSIWAGRKYWDRLQLGINDQFLENEDSNGFGVENMDLGFGKLSIGFGVDPNNTANNTYGGGVAADSAGNNSSRRFKIAAHLAGIQTLNKDSSLQIWGAIYQDYADKDLVPKKVDTGYRIAVYHNFGLGTAGNLFVGFKYHGGDGISGMDGKVGEISDPTAANYGKINKAWRVFAQYGVSVPSIRTSFDFLTEYRDRTPAGGGDHNKWFTVGARADAQLSGPFRGLLEVGYDRVQDGSNDATTLLKITPVLAISAGNDPWSRPTFRLYYTFANWSDPGVLDGYNSAGSQALAGPTKKSLGSFGVQAEGWW